MQFSTDSREITIRTIKYIIIAVMVGLACIFIPQGSPLLNNEIMMISFVASITFALLDMYSPSVSIVIK